jgi:predicted dithiol-disulfide oxidoreductase (DUF899 family)
MIDDHPVVSHDAWVEARLQLLAQEKEFTRLRDQLSAERRALPWERVEALYLRGTWRARDARSVVRQPLAARRLPFHAGP